MRRALALAAVVVTAFFAAFAGGNLLGALVPLAGQAGTQEGTAGERDRRILLVSSLLHTDFALPADPDVVARFAFLADGGLPVADPAVEWIVAGWGGRSFYLETPHLSDIRPGPLLKALTLDRAVMHVELTGALPQDHPAITSVTLGEEAFGALLDHIEASFARDDAGRPILVEGRSYHEFDRFYEALGRFNAFAGCNIWTARGLRAAGVATGLWTPLPLGLDASVRLHNPPGIVPVSVPGVAP